MPESVRKVTHYLEYLICDKNLNFDSCQPYERNELVLWTANLIDRVKPSHHTIVNVKKIFSSLRSLLFKIKLIFFFLIYSAFEAAICIDVLNNII